MEFDPDLNWKVIDDKGFNTHFGPILYRRTETQWMAAIELADQHMNTGGVCHGGVYMALADVTMGIGASQSMDRRPAATISFDSHFVAAAKFGQPLMCVAELNRTVSGLAFMQCHLWSGGRQCMRASGIWKALSGAPRKLP